MAKTNECWGIEVGAHAIKAIHLARKGDAVEVLGYDMLRFNKVLTAPDVDADEQIQINLEKLLNRHKDMRRRTVVVSVPGNMAFARFAKLPPVEPKNLMNIVKFEAQQQIPFPIEQVEWDYQMFAEPDDPDVEVGIFAITKERVDKFLKNFEKVGLPVDGITLSPLALYNSMVYDMELTPESPGVIFMDIGTTSTDLVIVEGGSIWLRTLPIGGNNFTEALVRSFKLSFDKAEKLKREAGTSKYARQIFQAMRPVFADLVQEMQRSLGFYQSINRDANLQRLVGFGSTFRLPGLQKFLKQQLQMDVQRMETFEQAEVDGKKAADFAERSLNLGTAYGLALQGVGLSRVQANLLPKRVIKKKVWRAKQPYVAAVAAALVIVTALSVAQLLRQQQNYNTGKDRHAGQIQRVIGEAQGYVNNWNEIEQGSDPRGKIENLRRVLDYRDAWPKLLQDLSLAMMSLNPDPVLLGRDYDRIAAIPRANRSRVYIQEVNASYSYTLDSGTSASSSGAPAPTALSIEDVWAQVDIDEEGAVDMSFEDRIAQMTENTKQAQVDGQIATAPPSFEIRVKGYSPNPDAPERLAKTFIAWLQENEIRRDRPYRLEVSDRPLVRIQPVTERTRATPTATTAPPRPNTSRLGGLNRRMPNGMELGNMNQRLGVGTSRSPADTATALSLEGLLPERPLSNELRTDDWTFEIVWKIEFLPPAEIRKTEQSAQEASASAPARSTTPAS